MATLADQFKEPRMASAVNLIYSSGTKVQRNNSKPRLVNGSYGDIRRDECKKHDTSIYHMTSCLRV